MEYRLIKCERLFDNAVLKIVLNAPKANVLEAAMLGEILQELAAIEKPDGVVDLRGGGSNRPSARDDEVPPAPRNAGAPGPPGG